jgi:aspartate/methionine/tyrosine aminotransferase
MSSEYMYWAKLRSQARFNVASSGLVNYPLQKLPVKIEELEISGPSWYGYEPLQNALASKAGVSPRNVVAATGTSMANHLVMAATLHAGEEVLIEHPTYELLINVAEYLGAEIKRFTRAPENGFRISLDEIARRVTGRTRLIVLTNLHNPTSAYTDKETLLGLKEIAGRVGARILVDEVYLAAMFDDAPPSAFHLGEEFITTNSLTKVYGLSGLRCGWILAEASLAEKLWRLNDLFGVIPAHTAERLSVIALENFGRIEGCARRLLETNARILNSFLTSRDDLECTRHEYGTVSFPRLKGQASSDELCRLLAEKYETSVVPGRFFEMPRHFRIGTGCETDILTAGLERLAAALDEMRKTK